MHCCTLRSLRFALLPSLLLIAHSVSAGPWIWDGGGADDSVFTGENWNPDAVPLFDNTNSSSLNTDSAIIFTGNVRTTPVVNTVGSTGHFNSITFDANAAAFTLSGFGPLRLGPTSTGIPRALTNNSPHTQTFDVEFTASAGNIVAAAGDVVFNQNFKVATSATGSSAASTRRNQVLAGNVYFNNGLSGFGTDKLPAPGLSGTGGFFVAAGGTAFITAESDSFDADHIDLLWNGRVEITNGVLQISHDKALGAGASADLGFFGASYESTPPAPDFPPPIISGRTTIGTSVADTGRLQLAGDGDGSIDSSERLFITGRSASIAAAPAHIRNLNGVNTLSGPIETQNIADARNTVIEAHDDGTGVAELLTISGDLTQNRDPAGGGDNTLVLRGNGAGVLSGDILNGATPAAMTWELHKLDGGAWTIDGAGNNYTGATHVAAGTLALGAGGTLATSSVVQVDAGATFDVSAQAGFTLGSIVAQTLKGDGAIAGDVNFASGSRFEVDYNGSVVDSLAVSGALNITNAALDFTNLGAALTTGAHVIASYGSLTGGAFASVIDLPAGFSLDYNYQGGNQIAVVGSAGLPGDFDVDGDVDGNDFLTWQRNFSVGSLADWRNNFGANAVASVGAVPEPSALAICLMALAALGAARRA